MAHIPTDYDSQLESGFHLMILHLKDLIDSQRSRGEGVTQIAHWAGASDTLVYTWVQGHAAPKQIGMLVRLARNAARDGYLQVMQWLCSGSAQVSATGTVLYNGCLSDEQHDTFEAWGMICQGDTASDGRAVVRGGEALIAIGKRVVKHGEVMIGQVAGHVPIDLTAGPTGDGR